MLPTDSLPAHHEEVLREREHGKGSKKGEESSKVSGLPVVGAVDILPVLTVGSAESACREIVKLWTTTHAFQSP